MRELSIAEIKKIQYDILLFFHNMCEEHGITYYLSNGTLLGAVKYKGCIPWDDDIDVCMPRPDYDRLMEIWKDISSAEYELFSIELNDNYLFPFAKLSRKGTVLNELNVDNGVTLGVNIDVFPLDGFGNNKVESEKIYKKMDKLRCQLHWSKCDVSKTSNPIKRFLKHIISFKYKLKGAKKICLEISTLAQQRKYSEDAYIGNSVWGFYSPGEAHERSVFADKVRVTFEENDFYAPIGYDTFLRKLYGDYRKDPPIEKQVTHHCFKAYKNEE